MMQPLVENSRKPGRILVVDDEVNLALTLKDGLNKLPNCEVAMATSGEQALQLFAEQPFDLLITDHKMPGLDGLTLATRVRRLYPLTAIVMMTAYGNDDLRKRATRVSIRHFLDKPVQLTYLSLAVLEALSQPKR
jgi:two-component system response regulator AtoC